MHPARTLWAAQNGEATPDPLDWVPQTTAVWRQGDALRVDAVDAPGIDGRTVYIGGADYLGRA